MGKRRLRMTCLLRLRSRFECEGRGRAFAVDIKRADMFPYHNSGIAVRLPCCTGICSTGGLLQVVAPNLNLFQNWSPNGTGAAHTSGSNRMPLLPTRNPSTCGNAVEPHVADSYQPFFIPRRVSTCCFMHPPSTVPAGPSSQRRPA